MARRKAKTKTAVMTFRVSPLVKAAAERAAEYERRSVTNLVEVLILDRCKTLNIQLDPLDTKETSR